MPELLAGGWRADLRFLPDDDHTQALVTAAGARCWAVRREIIRKSPYTRTEGDFDEFLRSALLSRRRRTLRRHEEKLAARGRVDFEVHDGRSDLSALFTEGFRIELAGWKGREDTAVLSRPETEQFYRSAPIKAARAGILRPPPRRPGGRVQLLPGTVGVTHFVKIVFDGGAPGVRTGPAIDPPPAPAGVRQPGTPALRMAGRGRRVRGRAVHGVREQVRLQL